MHSIYVHTCMYSSKPIYVVQYPYYGSKLWCDPSTNYIHIYQGIIYPGTHRTLKFIIAPLQFVPHIEKNSLRINAFHDRSQK